MKKAPKILFRLQADGTWNSTQGRSLLTIGDDTLTDARAALKANYVVRRNGRAEPRQPKWSEELAHFWEAVS